MICNLAVCNRRRDITVGRLIRQEALSQFLRQHLQRDTLFSEIWGIFNRGEAFIQDYGSLGEALGFSRHQDGVQHFMTEGGKALRERQHALGNLAQGCADCA